MPEGELPGRLTAELLGTASLVARFVDSGIRAEILTRSVGLQLLCNTLPTGAILVVLFWSKSVIGRAMSACGP